MSSTLDALINWKQNQDAQAAQRGQSISNAAQLFTQARQQNVQNQLAGLGIRAQLAQSALSLDNNGNISFNGNLLNPFQQKMAGLQALSAAAQTQSPQAYQQMLEATGYGQDGSQPQQGQNASNIGGIPSSISQYLPNQQSIVASPATTPNVSPAGSPNENVPTSTSFSVNPTTGSVTPSVSTTNIPGTQKASLANNQATQVGLANTEAAQTQAQLDASKNALGEMAKLHQSLIQGGAAGDPAAEARYKNSNFPLIGGFIENPTMADKAATLKTLAQKYGESAIQPDSATFGGSGAKRIGNLMNSSSGDLGNLNNTADQFNGTVRGELISAAQKSIGLKRYGNSLKDPQDLNKLSDFQILSGIKSQIGKITPQEQRQINKMVNSTLGQKIDPISFTAKARAAKIPEDQIQQYLKDNQ